MDRGFKPSSDCTFSSDKNRIENHLKRCLELFKMYGWLIDCFLAEFFVENLWMMLPESWQDPLSALSIEDLHKLISRGDGNNYYSAVLPLSLQAFISSCHHLALPRYQKSFNNHSVSDKADLFEDVSKLPHCFRKHVKPKKQHELMNFSKAISKLSKDSICDTIVDVGGGLGHLSRYLAFAYKLKVITVESQGHHKPIAEKFDREAVKDIVKLYKKDAARDITEYFLKSPVHVTSMISPNVKPEEFRTIISQARRNITYSPIPSSTIQHESNENTAAVNELDLQSTINSSKSQAKTERNCCYNNHNIGEQALDHNKQQVWQHYPNDADSFILTGLHTCGDLASTLIKVFINCPEIKGLALIGCCYMKLTHWPVQTMTRLSDGENGDEKQEFGSTSCSDMNGIVGKKRDFNFKCNFENANTETTNSGPISCLYELSNHIECSNEVINFSKLSQSLDLNESCNPSESDVVVRHQCQYSCSNLYTDPQSISTHTQSADNSKPNSKQSQVISTSTSLQEHAVDYGYPMSRFLRKEKYQPFEWCAFELACHNFDNYCQRLKDNDNKLRLQCYRAILEVVIRRIKPELKNPSIRCCKIKNSAKLSFKEYAGHALHRIDIEMPPYQLLDELQVERLLFKWKDVIIFYCLRLLLGPVIETVILLDRILFLLENGYEAELCPVFDATISPRNFAIIAKKKCQHQEMPGSDTNR